MTRAGFIFSKMSKLGDDTTKVVVTSDTIYVAKPKQDKLMDDTSIAEAIVLLEDIFELSYECFFYLYFIEDKIY